MNLAHLLSASRRWKPSAPALHHGTGCVDYLALEMAAQRVATVLRERYGMRVGDRIAVMLPDVPELAFVYYGILWSGAVVVVLNPTLDCDGVASRLAQSGTRLMIAWHALAEVAERASAPGAVECLFVEPREFSRLLAGVTPHEPLSECDAGDPAVLLHPAAAVWPGAGDIFSHGELILGARRVARSMALEPVDVVLCEPSLGLWVEPGFALNAVVASGALLLLLGPRDAALLTLTHADATHQVTVRISERGLTREVDEAWNSQRAVAASS